MKYQNKAKKTRSSSQAGTAVVWLLTVIILGTSLIQGGFYPSSYLVAGTALAILALTRWHRRRCLPGEYVLLGLTGWTVISSLANGYDADAMAQAAITMPVLMLLQCWLCLAPSQRRRVMRLVRNGSGLLAGVAILIFAGVFHTAGGIVAGRLQFPFQYANATGTWYAAMALLFTDGDDGTTWARVPILMAMMLSQSVGALVVYAALVVTAVVKSVDRRAAWQEALLTHFIAAALAVATYFTKGILSIPVMAIAYLVSLKLRAVVGACRKGRLHWVALLLGMAMVVPVAMSGRVSSAVGTFAERIVQIADGTAATLDHPLFGIGAGNWERVFPHYQTAQYTATVMHSAPVEQGLNGGIPALALFAAFIVLGFRARGRTRGETLAAELLTLHGAFDFNLRFFPILGVLTALFYNGAIPLDDEKGASWRRYLCGTACGVLAMTMAFLCVTKRLERQVVLYAANGDFEAAEAAYNDCHGLLGADRNVMWVHAAALYEAGDLTRANAALGDPYYFNADELIMCAHIRADSGDKDGACELLLSQIEGRLYDVPLFEATEEYLVSTDAPPEQLRRYNAIAQTANEKIGFLGELMGNQVQINKISYREENEQ